MKMKKILAAVLAGVMALSATACSSSSTKKIESPDDFAGAKVSVQTGTTGQSYVDGDESFDFAGLTATSVGYQTGSLAVNAMLTGDVDYVIIDEAPAACIVKAVNALNG